MHVSAPSSPVGDACSAATLGCLLNLRGMRGAAAVKATPIVLATTALQGVSPPSGAETSEKLQSRSPPAAPASPLVGQRYQELRLPGLRTAWSPGANAPASITETQGFDVCQHLGVVVTINLQRSDLQHPKNMMVD